MELRQIQYFVQLYKDRNITKASQALFISQQGLSKSISNLETELNLRLFHRSSLGVTPTDYADKLYPSFQKLLLFYHNLNLEIKEIQDSDTLHIAAYNGFSLACEKNKFSEYLSIHPQASTMYTEYNHPSLISCLENHLADIAYMLAPIPDIFQSHLFISKEPLYAVLSKQHPLSAKETFCIQDLYGQELLLLDLYHEILSSILNAADSMEIPYHIHKRSGIHEFLPLIQSGLFVGFSSKRIFQYFNFPDIVFLPMLDENGSAMSLDTHLVTLKDRISDKKIEDFIAYESSKLQG